MTAGGISYLAVLAAVAGPSIRCLVRLFRRENTQETGQIDRIEPDQARSSSWPDP